MACDRFL